MVTFRNRLRYPPTSHPTQPTSRVAMHGRWLQRACRLLIVALLIPLSAQPMEHNNNNKLEHGFHEKVVSGKMIQLMSNDNKIIEISREAVLHSGIIKSMLDDLGDADLAQPIPIKTSHETLQHIVNCLNIIQDSGTIVESTLKTYVQSVTVPALQELLFSANFFNIQELLAPCVKEWSNYCSSHPASLALLNQTPYAIPAEISRVAAQHLNFLPTLKNWLLDSATQPSISTKKHPAQVTSLAFHPSNPILASCCGGNKIQLLNMSTQKTTHLKYNKQDIFCVCFSPDGKILASGAADGQINLWDINKNKKIMTIAEHAHSVHALRFNHNGTLLASGSANGKINIWNIATHRSYKNFSMNNCMVFSVCFNHDGTHLASGSADGKISLWNVAEGSLTSFNAQHTGWVRSVCFSPNGKLIVSGSEDKNIKIWEVENNRLVTTLNQHLSQIYTVQFHPHDNMFISIGGNNEIKLWKYLSNDAWICLHNLTKPENHAHQICFEVDDPINLFDFNAVALNHKTLTRTGSFNQNGKLLACASQEGKIGVWDIDLLQEINTFFDSIITVEQAQLLNLVYQNNTRKKVFNFTTPNHKMEYAVFQTIPEKLRTFLVTHELVIVTAHKEPKESESCQVQ